MSQAYDVQLAVNLSYTRWQHIKSACDDIFDCKSENLTEKDTQNEMCSNMAPSLKVRKLQHTGMVTCT